MTAVVRTIALLIAVAAAVDPAISASRSRPVAVEFRTGPGEQAAHLRERLLGELGDSITLAHKGLGDAVVIIDDRVDPETIRDDVSVSAVAGRPPAGANVRLVAARVPSLFLSGQEAGVEVDAELQEMAGRKSVLTVIQNGVEIGRTEHTWSGSRRERLSVPFVTIAAGTDAVRVTAAAFDGEIRQDDNTADARVVTIDRPLRIAFVEPRPSWSAGFVRRALESDPSFEVASVVRPSRGIDVRTANAPATLGALGAITPGVLDGFAVVLAGAPEELRTTDLEAMRAFMTERGGTVVFLPDRRPTGPYATFVTASGFDEVLLESPVMLESGARRAPRASELAIPRTPSPAMRVLASLPDNRPAIASWPVGEGALIFSGALDAWRFRAQDNDRFASFWRASIAAEALAAPPAIQVELRPAVVRRGTETRVIARIRRTEFDRGPGGTIRLPMVRAVATGTVDGRPTTEAVRLWPTTEPGVFEGRFTPAQNGTFEVHVTAGQARASADVVQSDNASVEGDSEEASFIAAATGGAVGSPDNLAPIVNHLRSRSRAVIQETVHPMRSRWWVVPFALALSAEWALRRRRGER